MTRRVWFRVLLGVLLAGSGWAFAPAPVYREPPQPRVPDLHTSIQGTWEFEQEVPAPRGRAAGVRVTRTIRINGTSWVNDDGGSPWLEGGGTLVIVLDPTTKPASFDLVKPIPQGMPRNVIGQLSDEEPMMKGIVQIVGDRLTLCYVEWGQRNMKRPKGFLASDRITEDGTLLRLLTLKRVE